MRKFLSIFLVLAVIACNTTYQPSAVQYKDYKVTPAIKQDGAVAFLLKPYADSVNKKMSDIIAVSAITLDKKQPEGTLGNILADAMLVMAEQKYKIEIDAAFINYGGIRLPSIPAGDISRGKIYELAPFDNLIVVQKINGKILQEFLDHISGKGGWPGAGITWQIKDKKAINVLINNKPLNENAIYTIANNDYVANGGDDCKMLKGIPQQNSGFVFRDAVIEYFSSFTKQGKKIFAQPENRVSYAN
ncbi:MAG: 5'-nucleotidase C-terminal domain-containing protein [Chitinophagaceae bacterium]|nr:5'-nucleotidase C-terminal domain-containing protein [Chitinophagaceae bacterium]